MKLGDGLNPEQKQGMDYLVIEKLLSLGGDCCL